MIAIVAVYAVVGVFLIAFGAGLGRRAFVVGALPCALTVAWLAARLGEVVDGRVFTSSVTWVGALDLALDLRLDGLAATMTLIVGGVGVLVFLYAACYFGPDTPNIGRLSGVLVLFGGAMVGLVQADNFFILYTFWELTSITSFLLIGIQHTDARARAAALHALLVTSAGGLAMLGGFVLITTETGASRLSQLAAGPRPTGTVITVALVFLLIGAFTKSAQYPFHAWLPGAMAAPTPVSAYLHSATMVTAGVYLVARLAPVFATATLWRPIVFAVGSVTILAAGLHALRQRDLKLMLAFGTVSQLGFMMVLFGAGTADAALAGWLLLVAHALFKAALFMVVGILDRETGTRDVRYLPALGRGWWWIEATAAVAAAAMAGVPLTAGFIAKETDFESLADARFGGHWFLVAVVVVGSVFTAAYSAKFYWARSSARAGARVARPHRLRRCSQPRHGRSASPPRCLRSGASCSVSCLQWRIPWHRLPCARCMEAKRRYISRSGTAGTSSWRCRALHSVVALHCSSSSTGAGSHSRVARVYRTASACTCSCCVGSRVDPAVSRESCRTDRFLSTPA